MPKQNRITTQLKEISDNEPDLFNREVFGNDWQCPYCGRLAVKDCTPEDRMDLMEVHLGKCSSARKMKGPLLDLHRLEQFAQRYRIARMLNSDPGWRVFTPEGSWACPYCVSDSGIGATAAELLDGVMKHLEDCVQFNSGAAPVEGGLLKTRIVERYRHDRMLSRIVAMINKEPLLRYYDSRDRWVCPFCENSVEDVDASAENLNMAEDAANHMLSGGCAAITSQFRFKKNTRAMQALVLKINNELRSGSATPTGKKSTSRRLRAMQRTRAAAGHQDTDAMVQERRRAANVQARMQPKEVPQLEGYDLGYVIVPAEEVSGDFVDLQKLGTHWLSIGIGDVSGHGLAAGMVMSMSRKAISMCARDGNNPRTVLAKVNREIFPDLESDMFVTVLQAILDSQEHVLRFARAGHSAPIVVSPTQPAHEVHSGGISIGLVEGSRFIDALEEESISIEPGCFILIYTDGLIEQVGQDGSELGVPRLIELVDAHKHEVSAQAFYEGILESVLEFAGDNPLDDDITLIAIRRNSE